MKKKYIEYSAADLRAKKKGKPTSKRQPPDEEIDFSDSPELTDKQLKKMKRVGRPLLGDSPRVPITIRIEKDVLDKLKKEARKRDEGYQSLINKILKKAV